MSSAPKLPTVRSRERLQPGVRGVDQTIARMRDAIDRGGRSELVRFVAEQAVDTVAAHDRRGEVDALFGWFTGMHGITYRRDPRRVERVQEAEAVLRSGVGDCDDMTVLGLSMAEALGYPTRIEVGTTRRAAPGQPPQFHHVYGDVLVDGTWTTFDPVLYTPRRRDAAAGDRMNVAHFRRYTPMGRTTLLGTDVMVDGRRDDGTVLFDSPLGASFLDKFKKSAASQLSKVSAQIKAATPAQVQQAMRAASQTIAKQPGVLVLPRGITPSTQSIARASSIVSNLRKKVGLFGADEDLFELLGDADLVVLEGIDEDQIAEMIGLGFSLKSIVSSVKKVGQQFDPTRKDSAFGGLVRTGLQLVPGGGVALTAIDTAAKINNQAKQVVSAGKAVASAVKSGNPAQLQIATSKITAALPAKVAAPMLAVKSAAAPIVLAQQAFVPKPPIGFQPPTVIPGSSSTVIPAAIAPQTVAVLPASSESITPSSTPPVVLMPPQKQVLAQPAAIVVEQPVVEQRRAPEGKLSKGAKIGIGIGAGVLVLGGAAALFLTRKKKKPARRRSNPSKRKARR